jgi:hypothetical protein
MALLAYLLCAVVVTTVHQHNSAIQAGDCALCTLAHTPAIVAPTTPQPAATVAPRAIAPVRDARIEDSGFRQASRSRAPPQG